MDPLPPQNNLRLIFVFIIVTLVVFGLGFIVGQRGFPLTQTPQIKTPAQEMTIEQNSFFRTQTATAFAKITKIEGDILSLSDEQSRTGTFPVSKNILVYKQVSNSPRASASADLKLVDIGKKALLVFEVMDGKYQVVSISYLNSP